MPKRRKFDFVYLFVSDLTKIPSNSENFELFVENHLKKKKDLTIPYLLNEFVNGPEFAANVVCKNGQIYEIHVCPSSPIQTNYVSLEHQGIENWLELFVEQTNLSGLVCFDFLVDGQSGEVFCIECNPRLHSAVTSFRTPVLVSCWTFVYFCLHPF